MSGSRRVPLAVAIAADGRPKYLLAAMSGLPPNTLGGILSGRIDPTPAMRERLAETLGTTESQLFPAEVSA